MEYEAKGTEVKQARLFKPEVKSHNSEHVDLASSGKGRPQENMILRFSKVHKKNRFSSKSKNLSAEVHCMKFRIKWENKNFDDMGTLHQLHSRGVTQY